jgi:pimeloyl-ACP methyl ester carboxylesterase
MNLKQGIVFFCLGRDFKHFAMHVFDYGSPVALRLALEHPERIAAARTGASAGKKCGPQSPVWDRVSNVMKCRVRFAPEVVARKFCLGEPDSSVVINNGFPDFRVESLTRFRPAFPNHRTRAFRSRERGRATNSAADGTGKGLCIARPPGKPGDPRRDARGA